MLAFGKQINVTLNPNMNKFTIPLKKNIPMCAMLSAGSTLELDVVPMATGGGTHNGTARLSTCGS